MALLELATGALVSVSTGDEDDDRLVHLRHLAQPG